MTRAALIVLLTLTAISGCKPSAKVNQADEYDLETKDEPTCFLEIRLSKPGESKRLLDILDRFAAAHRIPKPAGRAILTNGRELPPLYASDDIIIAPMVFDFPPVPPERQRAQIRIHVLRRSYPIAEFLALAEDFHATFQREFGDQIQSWEGPNNGTKELNQ